jgi:4-diphosphocytidyl-2-C-methyl-D-erythritol kinase
MAWPRSTPIVADGGVEERAPAKLNLDLHVQGRRADGYHDLDSIVVFAEPGDRLRLALGEPQLSITGPFAPAVPGDDRNLAARAALAISRRCGRDPAVAIRLDKRLPVAAGLGGGSADAAAVLRAANRLWGQPLDPGELHRLAAELGADVPVCLGGRPVRMEGRGDRLTLLPGWPALDLVLVNPGVPLATAAVFAARHPAEAGARPQPIPEAPDLAALLAYLQGGRNDLEPAAIRLSPSVARVLGRLRAEAHCRIARMSGSGSTCFGIFGSASAAQGAANAIAREQPGWWVMATRSMAAA